MERAGISFDEVLALGARFPGVEESTSYGTRAIKVKGKLMARLKEDGETIVLRTPFVVRDYLMSTQPSVFFTTDHYRDYPSVLVRLKMARKTQLAELIEAAWREFAPRKLVADFDAGTVSHEDTKPKRAR